MRPRVVRVSITILNVGVERGVVTRRDQIFRASLGSNFEKFANMRQNSKLLPSKVVIGHTLLVITPTFFPSF